MLRTAFLICSKDLRLILVRSAGLAQALLLGLLLVFVFSLSQDVGERLAPQEAGAMFWLASAFCQVLIFNMLFAVEEPNQTHMGLLLMPAPLAALWLGKALGGFFLLAVSQALFIPATMIFLGQGLGLAWPTALAGLVLVDVGMAASGALLGALSVGQSGRESLLSIIIFPLLIPLLLAGIRTAAAGLSLDIPAHSPAGLAAADTAFADLKSWLGLAAAFDALFVAAGLVLFPFMYGADE